MFFAFLGYKFFRLELALSGLTTGYYFGSNSLRAYIGDAIVIDPSADKAFRIILGVACAAIGLFFAYKFYKLALTFYILLPLFADMLLIEGAASPLRIAITAIVSIIVIIFVFKFYRHFYIGLSSILGFMLVAIGIGMLVTSDATVQLYIILAGLFLSIIPIKVQLNTTEDMTN